MSSENKKNTAKPPHRPDRNRSQKSRSGPKSHHRSPHRKRSRQRNSRWNRHRISEHFTKRDFDSREKGCACSSSLRISLGLVGVIEAIRAKINKRVEIVTGFYCSDCRPRQYGIKRDYHHTGVAADIRVTDMSVVDLFLEAETYPEIKGLGINFDDNHVHIDTRKEDDRQSWVEINNEWILLTDENRSQYISTVDQQHVNSAPDS